MLETYSLCILRIVGNKDCFNDEYMLPLLMIASYSNINKSRESAELLIRSIMQKLDTANQKMCEQIFKLIFSETDIYCEDLVE